MVTVNSQYCLCHLVQTYSCFIILDAWLGMTSCFYAITIMLAVKRKENYLFTNTNIPGHLPLLQVVT